MKKGWNSKWEKFYKKSDGNSYPEAAIIRFVANNYYGAKDRYLFKILDLGCGTGAVQWYLAREGFDTYGIDASPTAIKKSRNRLRNERLRSDLRIGDFTSLPYGNESMDAIIDAASIQHNNISSIKEIINEIYRVLKSNGRFFGMLIAQHWQLSDPAVVTRFFPKDELQALF